MWGGLNDGANGCRRCFGGVEAGCVAEDVIMCSKDDVPWNGEIRC